VSEGILFAEAQTHKY